MGWTNTLIELIKFLIFVAGFGALLQVINSFLDRLRASIVQPGGSFWIEGPKAVFSCFLFLDLNRSYRHLEWLSQIGISRRSWLFALAKHGISQLIVIGLLLVFFLSPVPQLMMTYLGITRELSILAPSESWLFVLSDSSWTALEAALWIGLFLGLVSPFSHVTAFVSMWMLASGFFSLQVAFGVLVGGLLISLYRLLKNFSDERYSSDIRQYVLISAVWYGLVMSVSLAFIPALMWLWSGPYSTDLRILQFAFLWFIVVAGQSGLMGLYFHFKSQREQN